MAPETSAPATNVELRVQQAEIHAGPFAHVSDQARLEAATAMRSVVGICGATGRSASETGGDSPPKLRKANEKQSAAAVESGSSSGDESDTDFAPQTLAQELAKRMSHTEDVLVQAPEQRGRSAEQRRDQTAPIEWRRDMKAAGASSEFPTTPAASAAPVVSAASAAPGPITLTHASGSSSGDESDSAPQTLAQETLARMSHTEDVLVQAPEQGVWSAEQRRDTTPLKGEFYSEEGMVARVELLEKESIKQALEDLWTAANCVDPTDEIIDKQEYAIMHRKIVLHLQPMATPAEAMDATEEDWLRDTMGEAGLGKERFFVSWFELADLWTESMEASEYEDFLTGLLEAIVVQSPDGMIEWKRDSDIIREHFKKRQEQGKKVTDTHNMPLCLSRWHKHLKNQAVQRAAALAADKIRAGLEAARVRPRRGSGSGYSTSIAAAFAAGIGASRRGSQAPTEAGRSLRSSFGPGAASQAPTEAGQSLRSSFGPSAVDAADTTDPIEWQRAADAADVVGNSEDAPAAFMGRRHSMGATTGRRASFVGAVDACCDLPGRGRRASCAHASDGASRPSCASFVDAFKPRFSGEGSGGPSLRSSFVDACYDHAVRGPTRTLSPNLDR